MRQLSAILLGLACLYCGSAASAAPPPAAVTEVNYLLGFVDRSNCKFYRNGSWYDSHRAQSHLRQKYDYLAARDRIKSAEDFIEQAATKSSMSGENYQIQCEAGSVVPSANWLRTALADFRASANRHAAPKVPVSP